MSHTAMRARALGWTQEERGWWTKDGVGGICQERDRRWYVYPIEGGPYEPWSYSTLLEALHHFENDGSARAAGNEVKP